MPHESKRVLVVEDDALLQSMMVILLETLQYRVVTASTVAEGKMRLENMPFDLVLLDMSLPDGSGLAVFEAVSSTGDGPLVIVTTADDSIATVIGALRSGAFDYLTKPIHLEVMQRTLQRATDHITLQRTVVELDRLQAQAVAVRATAGAAVHHLSQDLTVVLSEAQLLEEIVDDTESLEGMHRIVTAVRRAASTLDTLRNAQRFVTTAYSSGDTILDVAAAGASHGNGWDAGGLSW